VQILVVVANIQARTLKAEVEKGFVRTVFDHESVDPKAQINLVKGDDRFPTRSAVRGGRLRASFSPRVGRDPTRGRPRRAERESGLIFPNPSSDETLYGDVNEPGEGDRCPGKSSLFFLTTSFYYGRPWNGFVPR